MSHVSLNNSDTTETGTIMYATRVPEGTVHSVEQVTELVRKKPEHERFLILCDDAAARSTMRAFLGTGIKMCLFVLEICEDPIVIDEEVNKFDSLNVAICSFEAYRKVDLSHVENFAIIGFPKKVRQLATTIDKIEANTEAEGHMTRIDFIVSAGENPKFLSILQMELLNRKGKECCPFWLAEAVILGCAPPERQAHLIEEQRRAREQPVTIIRNQESANVVAASDTSGSPMTSFSHGSEHSPNSDIQAKKLKVKRPEDDFDIYSMKPNSDGKYIVPFKMIDYGEQDDDDYFESDEEESYEADYNYDDEFDPEYDNDFI